MSTVPSRTGLLQKTWSLIQIHPGKMLCMQQTDLCMHRLTAGFKPQGKKRKMLFSKKQAQKISSVMDQDLHECVLSRQSRVATCSIWRICCLANFQMKTFHMHLKEKNCNSKFGPKYIFLKCGAAGGKKINQYIHKIYNNKIDNSYHELKMNNIAELSWLHFLPVNGTIHILQKD